MRSMLLILTAPAAFAALTARPSPSLSPLAVVEAQLQALSEGDVSTCFAFASPQNKAQTGPWQRFEIMVRQTPAYSPLVCCTSFEVLSALALSEQSWQARVAVRPAGSSSAPFAVANPMPWQPEQFDLS